MNDYSATTETESNTKSVSYVVLLYSIVTVVLSVMTLSAPISVLLDRFIPDDAFYYYNTARIFSQTGFSSFDGLHFTNGYQPLWFLINIPFYWMVPNGGELPLRMLLFLQIPLTLAAVVLLVRILAKPFGPVIAGTASLVWLVVFQRVTLNGLETSLQMCLYMVCMAWFARLYVHKAQSPSHRELIGLGAVVGVLFLARTDTVFLIVGLGLFILSRGQWRQTDTFKQNVRQLFLFATPVLVIGAVYLATNIIATGHLMPVSGAAKQFHSDVARQISIQETGRLRTYLNNLLWAFQEPGFKLLLVGLVGPWLLLLLSFVPALRSTLVVFRRFWPFYLGITGLYLFYAVGFYGGFTRTIWYYGPLVVWCCFTVAGVARGLDGVFPFKRIPGLAAILLVGLALRWISPIEVAGTLLVALVVGFISQKRVPDTNGVILCVAVITALILGLLFRSQGASTRIWLFGTVGLAFSAALLFGTSNRPARIAYMTALLLGATVAIHGTNLRNDLAAPPGNWNYNLYLGALWARDHLPANATIWSGSAGILGYFSEHKVVNTDGLANSYAFFEDVLKAGRLGEYQKQWDYAIDAFPNEDLHKWFPEGCFVPLVPEVTESAFVDGALTRQLRVFQMKPEGIVNCSTDNQKD
jgi:hypothetical protein